MTKSTRETRALLLLVGNWEAGLYVEKWVFPVLPKDANKRFLELKKYGREKARNHQSAIRDNVEAWEEYVSADYYNVLLFNIPPEINTQQDARGYVASEVSKAEYESELGHVVLKHYGQIVLASGRRGFKVDDYSICDALEFVASMNI